MPEKIKLLVTGLNGVVGRALRPALVEVCTAEAVSDTALIQLRRAFKEKQSGESKTDRRNDARRRRPSVIVCQP